MEGVMILVQLILVLAMIFIGAKVGGIGLGIYGMAGVFVLVFVFGLEPGAIVNVAARFLKRHPNRITFYAPFVTWLFSHWTGTAHTCYALLPIISEIARKDKVRPERPLSVATVSASLGCTGSPVSAATAAILSGDLLGKTEIGMDDILMITVPASLVAIFVAALVQNYVGKPLEKDPEYQRRLKEGLLDAEGGTEGSEPEINPRAKWAVLAFLLGVVLVVVFGLFPDLRPTFNGEPLYMSATIEMVMMSIAALILFVGKASVADAAKGNVFASGMNAMVAIFGVAEGVFTNYPLLFAIPLFVFSIMLFSQAATVRTLYPVGVAMGISPAILLVLFPVVNGYFFLPNYPTEVAAIGFDRTGTTRIGRFVINHSFQLAGFITTIVAVGVGWVMVVVLS